MKVEKIIESIENRKKVTNKLIKKLNLVWNPIIEKMENEELTFRFSNGYRLENYIESSNYGTWYDLISEQGNYLPKEGQDPNNSGYWCGNFDHWYSAMNRNEIIQLANDSKRMLEELENWQDGKVQEIENILKMFK